MPGSFRRKQHSQSVQVCFLAQAPHRRPSADGFADHISNMVLVETVWVLETAYGFDRAMVADTLTMLFEVEQFDFESPEDVATAIEEFRQNRAEFADCLLGGMNLFAGCEYTITFDRKAAKLPGFKLLTST